MTEKTVRPPGVRSTGRAESEGNLGAVLTQNTTAPRLPTPRFDPTGVRRCATCGRVDRWQRIEYPSENNGGFFCCWPNAPRTFVAEMRHDCTTALCGGAA